MSYDFLIELGETAQYGQEDPPLLTQFHSHYEAFFTSFTSGFISGIMVPSMEVYSSFQAHDAPVVDFALINELIASVSSDSLRVHSLGGVPLGTFSLEGLRSQGGIASLLPSSGRGAQGPASVLVGDQEGIFLFDYAAGRQVSRAADRVAMHFLRGPIQGSGAIVAGSATGQLSIRDPRAGLQVQASAELYSAGFSDISVHGDLIATCGLQSRGGRASQEPSVRLYDVRAGLRLLATVPVPGAAPNVVCLDPSSRAGNLVAGATDRFRGCGVLYLLDGPAGTCLGSQAVSSEGGAAIASVSVSTSGSLVVTADGAGSVRLWSRDDSEPAANRHGEALERPRPPRRPAVRLSEREPFGKVARALALMDAEEEGRLSDIDLSIEYSVGLPPRRVDPTLALKLQKSPEGEVDFAPNPHFARGAPRGTAARKAQPLLHCRAAQSDNASAQGDDYLRRKETCTRARLEKGLRCLPYKFRRMEVRSHTEGLAKFEEFDYGFHNRTVFAGLENEAANSYCNALLQALYYVPPLLHVVLLHRPSVSAEFRLTDEMSLLCRMLAQARGQPCQAKNFVRALRQSREAIGLGLLESHDTGAVQASKDVTDIEVETSKDKSLGRRAQSLMRFLLEALHRDMKEAGEKQGAQGAASVIESLFAVPFRQLTRAMGRVKAEKVTEGRQLLVDLVYPTPSAAATVAAAGGAPPGSAPAGPATPPPRPSFASLLQGAIEKKDEPMRAWFDDALQYQTIQRQRCPTALPPVMVVSTGLHDAGKAAFWAPVPVPGRVRAEGDDGPDAPPATRPWLPERIVVSADPATWKVQVEEGGQTPVPGYHHGPSPAQSFRQRSWRDAAGSGSGPTTPGSNPFSAAALRDPLSASGSGATPGKGPSSASAAPAPAPAPSSSLTLRAEYQLTAVVSHVVEAEDLEVQAAGPAAQRYKEGHLVAHLLVGPPYVDTRTQSILATPMGAQGVSPLPVTKLSIQGLTAAPPPAGPQSHPVDLSDTEDRSTGASPASLASPSRPAANEAPTTPAPAPAPSTPIPAARRSSAAGLPPHPATPIPTPLGPLLVTTPGPPDSAAHHPHTGNFSWFSLNDFHVAQSTVSEALDQYDGQQLPMILMYTRVDSLVSYHSLPHNPQVAAALTPSEFASACREPPLQLTEGTMPPSALLPSRFKPLDMNREAPRPGTLFGIDAEFVAYSNAEKTVEAGAEVITRPPRLGLARVSVVRGEGPHMGSCCIDDHVKTNEPVVDYLTRFSGLQAGDLDPSKSRHYLTTLRRAYLKLRYLADAGCIFIGHGLKKDLKMINIMVPPQQMIDTVELFHFKRQRKLSLRFLAAFLLGIDIQSKTHDSIEDARVAVLLYNKYKELKAKGDSVFVEKLLDAYRMGKLYGWEPAAWKPGQVEAFQKEMEAQGAADREMVLRGPKAAAPAEPEDPEEEEDLIGV